MYKHTSTYTAYGTLLGALVVWVSVAWFAYLIQTGQAQYATRVQAELNQSDQTSSDALIHILARSNTTRAESLDVLVGADVTTIINTIRSVGVASGVTVKINAALPGNMPKNQKDIHAVAFVIESTGSFAQLMHTLALFESLPLPSSVDTVDVSQVTDGSTGSGRGVSPWRMNLKLQVLTTVPVS